jgi:hypothetical protein
MKCQMAREKTLDERRPVLWHVTGLAPIADSIRPTMAAWEPENAEISPMPLMPIMICSVRNHPEIPPSRENLACT